MMITLGFLLLLIIPFSISSVLFLVFIACTGSFFVAKPRELTPDRHHQTKQGIPTMGGVILIAVWIGCLALLCRYSWQLISAVWLVLSMGALGAYDDWSKIQRTGGISARAKFIMQIMFALIATSVWYFYTPGAGHLWVPCIDMQLPLGFGMFIWSAFIIIATSNAVNLTDGLDGLAGTVLTLCFTSIAFYANVVQQSDLFFGSIIITGILLGFLCFNIHPARVFMGDTGALAFGALLGLYAVQLNITLLLPLIAVVPLVETVSVMLQVVWYKLYKKRIFKMAPFHHHCELSGYSEHQIVVGAACMTLVGCALALYIRYVYNLTI